MSFESLCSAIKTNNRGALDNILCVDPETTIKILRQTDDQNRNALMIIADNFKEEDQKTGEWQKFLKDVLEAIKMSESLDLIDELYSQVDNNGFNVLLSFYNGTDGVHAINQWIPNIGSQLVKKQLAQKTNKGDTALSLAAENTHRISEKEMEMCCGQLVMFNMFEEQYCLLSESHKKKLHDKGVFGSDWKPDPRMVSECQREFDAIDEYISKKKWKDKCTKQCRINEPYNERFEALVTFIQKNNTDGADEVLEQAGNEDECHILGMDQDGFNLIMALMESSVETAKWLFHRVSLPGLPESCSHIYLKRDDSTGGIELGGNKVRKLEFLLAEAKSRECDHILTAGGTQSNHVRATVAAACTVGLQTTCLIRDDYASESGNYFLDTLMGADIRFLKREFYLEKGGWDYFFESTLEELATEKKKNPYFVPVGGTCPLGNYGYLECVREILDDQLSMIEEDGSNSKKLTNIVTTTGSGSTLTGLALGAKLWSQQQQQQSNSKRANPVSVTGYGVCDSPEYFYDMCQKLYTGMLLPNRKKNPGEVSSNGVTLPSTDSKEWVECRNAKGLGYSKATDEELQFLNRVARETGVVFDRSYTNKAVMKMVEDLASGSLKPDGKLLFVHTGGGPSAFDRPERILKCQGWRDEDAK